MKDTIRRFSSREIAYHWCQATPYVVLFCTGTVMLLQRLLAIEVIPREMLSLIHRVAGVVLAAVIGQLILLSLYSGSFLVHFRTVRDTLSWGISDLIWFAKLPLNAFWPQIRLPPVGRFNPGQKINILLAVTAVPGFIVSGLSMMLIPGALAPWIVHLALFVPAGALFVVHHFFSLINPPTRKALSGIFTGYVSSDYMASHHPLVTGGKETNHRGSHVSLPYAVSMAVLAGFLFLCTVAAYGPEQLNSRIHSLWNHRGTEVIRPGELCASHANNPEARRCTTCHSIFSSPPSSACLACHVEIVLVMNESLGFHGKLNGECRICHADHTGKTGDIRRLDSEIFNHNLARYPLDGKHSELSCSECHVLAGSESINERTRYINLCFEQCSDCHKDPHREQFNKTCDHCHSEKGWKDRWLVDSHGEGTPYPLLGKHSAVECTGCHPLPRNGTILAGARFSDTPTNCDTCHDDPHQAQMRGTCATCHTEMGWEGRDLIFAHDRHSQFPIDAIHRSLTCDSCHPPDTTPRYRPLPISCEGCHKDVERELRGITVTATGKADPHADRVACTKCHPPELPSPSPAEYAGVCGTCHNRHYQELFYDWMKSLQEREARAYALLREFQEQNTPRLDELEKKIKEAQAVGIHNVMHARMLWNEILASVADDCP